MDADPGGSGRGLLVVVLAVEADAVDAVAMLLSALVLVPVPEAAEGADKNEALLPPTGGGKDTADVPAGSELLRALLPPPPFAEPPLALALLVVRRKGRGSRLLMVGGFVSFE